jgi:RimJ/RimL family protein N-acetyltransferase
MLVESKNVKLKSGQIVTLKSPEAGDAQKLLQHLNSVFGESYMNMNHPSNHFEKFPVAEEEKILADFAASSSKFMLSAFYENRIVGNLGMFGSVGEFLKHNARLGMGIEKKFCGLGLGSALLEHALTQAKRLKFHRIELTVRTFNEAGIKLYERVGFERVGLLKNAAFIDGRYFDEYMYQILLERPEVRP